MDLSSAGPVVLDTLSKACPEPTRAAITSLGNTARLLHGFGSKFVF